MTAPAVIFDFDGTLVDPFVGIANAYHHMCRELDIPDIDDADVRGLIGPPIQEAISSSFGFSGDALERAVARYRAYYATKGLHEFVKYPGIDELLTGLREKGFSLYVATSKPAIHAAREMVDEAGWSLIFSDIGGAELDGSRRHKADVVKWVLDHMGNDEVALGVVGDRPEDVWGASANGLLCVGVQWGFGLTASLVDAGASVVVSSARELEDELEALARRAHYQLEQA